MMSLLSSVNTMFDDAGPRSNVGKLQYEQSVGKVFAASKLPNLVDLDT